MSTFAVINNGVVSNVVVSDSQEVVEELTKSICVEYTQDQDVRIGMFYNSADNTFLDTYPEVE